ncbi:MAG: class I SAM-dependent methyltransferase [Bacteroidota bacterium]
MRPYDQIADWYALARDPEAGLDDLAAFACPLPAGAAVLDLGCGNGVPVSRFLLQQGFAVTGLDSSPAMLARYRTHFPAVPARCERAQDARFEPETFDAVVAWGVLFHLSETEQAAVIGKVARWLRPGGRFVFTSGEAKGVTESKMDGVTFGYTSLGRDAYRRLAEASGMRWVRDYTNAWDNHVYAVQKRPLQNELLRLAT